MPPKRQPIIAHHLILSSYGFWLPNDPRGSGSTELRERKFATLGEIHHGRRRLQPSRAELKVFHARASPRLDHTPLWFNAATRDLIANAFHDVIARHRYTVWACFIGSNHAHLCMRVHRDTYQIMFERLTGHAQLWCAEQGLIDPSHRMWAERPFSVYCYTPEDIWRTIKYVDENAEKESLAPQRWDFIKPYDNWPFAGSRSATS